MNTEQNPRVFAQLPSVDLVLQSDTASLLVEQYGRGEVTSKVRQAVQILRDRMRVGEKVTATEATVLKIAEQSLSNDAQTSLKPVLNLTGTVLHTNLGRASLPEEAIDEVAKVARGASNLEFDLVKGKRGNRDVHIEDLIVQATGAEAATVVNNNAAAVMLVLNTLALGREVPVSRGELVEIGGSFRIPEIMKRSGCTLVEVGTTNRTHLRDYAQAIGDNTGLAMKVHASNYVIDGFTAEVREAELADLCHSHRLPFVVDLGAGSLIDLERYGLPHEPTPKETLDAGADLVTFSADKLLGGPQAGIIVGRREFIDQVRANPMKRALRCDKMTIAALEAVLRLYRNPDKIAERLPTLRALTRSREEVREDALNLAGRLRGKFEGIADVCVVDCDSVIGSGALPTRTVPSCGIAIAPSGSRKPGGGAVERIERAFRGLPTPVIGRIHGGSFILDLRCLDDRERLAALFGPLELEI